MIGFAQKTREQYVNLWKSHIQQLSTLFLMVSTDETFSEKSQEWHTLRERLYAMVEESANQQQWPSNPSEAALEKLEQQVHKFGEKW